MRTLLLATSLILLSGCASTYREDSRTTQTNYLTQATLVADLSNKTLEAQYIQQNTQVVGAGALGGLIGGLVNAGINAYNASNAEDTVERLRTLMGEDALHRAYQGQYQLLLESLPELQGRPVHVWQEIPDGGITSLGLKPGEVALLLVPQYSLTVSKRRLHVELDAQLLEQMPSKKFPKVIYKNRFVYQSPAIESAPVYRSQEEIAQLRAAIEADFGPLPKDEYNRIKEKNKRAKKIEALSKPLQGQEYDMRQAALWLKDDASQLRRHFREGVDEIFAMFAHDYATVSTGKKFQPSAPQNRSTGRQWINVASGPLAGSWMSLLSNEQLELATPVGGMIYMAPAG
ncbi:hypothetical protein [Shewanella sp. GXUN23E]|uniref:hypothetical protein n=1 Tax=Shewanella sp. GXUN23E TaxID=3422498 RepID=UPI003D7D0215